MMTNQLGVDTWGEQGKDLMADFASRNSELFSGFIRAAYYFFKDGKYEEAGTIIGLNWLTAAKCYKSSGNHEKSTEL